MAQTNHTRNIARDYFRSIYSVFWFTLLKCIQQAELIDKNIGNYCARRTAATEAFTHRKFIAHTQFNVANAVSSFSFYLHRSLEQKKLNDFFSTRQRQTLDPVEGPRDRLGEWSPRSQHCQSLDPDKIGQKKGRVWLKKVDMLQIYSGIMLHKELLTKLKSCIYCPAHLHKGKKSLSQKGKILKEKTEKLIFSPEVKWVKNVAVGVSIR